MFWEACAVCVEPSDALEGDHSEGLIRAVWDNVALHLVRTSSRISIPWTGIANIRHVPRTFVRYGDNAQQGVTAPSLEFVGNKAANYQQGQYGQRDKLQQNVGTWASHFSLHLWSRQPIRHSVVGG